MKEFMLKHPVIFVLLVLGSLFLIGLMLNDFENFILVSQGLKQP